jgi:hypothetical protein
MTTNRVVLSASDYARAQGADLLFIPIRISEVRSLPDTLRPICLLLTVAGVGVALTGSAAAADPWNLHCASMPAEQPTPKPVAATARRFFPWVRPTAQALRAGPVYLVALSSHTQISRDGDMRDADNYYSHRALIAVAPSYTGPVTIAGGRLGRPGPRTALGFSTDGANHCTVSNPVVNCGNRSLHYAARLQIARAPGWRIVETELRIGRTGCFRVTATGTDLHAQIPLSIPGPDWGTPGW